MCFGVPLTLSKRDSAPKTNILIKDLSHLYCDAHLIVTDYKKRSGICSEFAVNYGRARFKQANLEKSSISQHIESVL